MSKTLKTVQTISKVCHILSSIAYVFSIIGMIGCGLGLVAEVIIGTDSIVINGVSIHSLIELNSNESMSTALLKMTIGLVSCIMLAINARLASKYFKCELEVGTPFDLGLAEQLKKLGIYTFVISILNSVFSGVIYEIFKHYYNDLGNLQINDFSSITLAIVFIVISFICKLGCENNETN